MHQWSSVSNHTLETDPAYLGIIAGAERSPGFHYVQWPGAPRIGDGAKLMCDAYGAKASVHIAEVDETLGALADALGAADVTSTHEEEADSTELVRASLDQWANDLSAAGAVTCLAGLAEASGHSVAAFEVLHRFWNSHAPSDREHDDFDRYRVAHGRLGMGLGIVSVVDDLGSNRGMESLQNLYRVVKRDARTAAWAGLAWVWAGKIEMGYGLMRQSELLYTEAGVPPEWKVDAWFPLAEAEYLRAEAGTFVEDWAAINALAMEAGDLPRQARAAAFQLLALVDFLPASYEQFRSEHAQPILDRAERLNDPSIAGFDALARGRRATKTRNPQEARAALELAVERLEQAGRRPWCVLAKIEYAKALMDEGRCDDSADMLNHINGLVDRYQLLLPWYEEARGQHHLLVRRPDIARQSFEQALEYAEQFGLTRRALNYRAYLDDESIWDAKT